MLDEKIFLIDAIGPFFRDYKKVRVNWSKIPWRRIQKLKGDQRRAYFDRVRDDLRTFCRRVADTGYNAVSMDDLPHLADHSYYETEVRDQIAQNTVEFRELFKIVREAGLKI